MGQDTQSFADKLQAKATEFKTNVTAAAAAGEAAIDARVQAAKAQAEKSKAAIQEKVSSDKAAFDQKLAEIKAKLQAKGDEIRGKIDQDKADFKARQAERDAEDAEEYAANTLATAFYYIDETASAVAQAHAARLKAEVLRLSV